MFGMLVSLLVLLSLVYLGYLAAIEVYAAIKTRRMEQDVLNTLHIARSDANITARTNR